MNTDRVDIQDLYNKDQAFHPNMVLDFQSGQAAFRRGKVMFSNIDDESTKINTTTIIGLEDGAHVNVSNGESSISSDKNKISVTNNGISLTINGNIYDLEAYIKEVVRKACLEVEEKTDSSVVRIPVSGSFVVKNDIYDNNEVTSNDVTFYGYDVNKYKVFMTTSVDENGNPTFSGLPYQTGMMFMDYMQAGSISGSSKSTYYVLIISNYGCIFRKTTSDGSLVDPDGYSYTEDDFRT